MFCEVSVLYKPLPWFMPPGEETERWAWRRSKKGAGSRHTETKNKNGAQIPLQFIVTAEVVGDRRAPSTYNTPWSEPRVALPTPMPSPKQPCPSLAPSPSHSRHTQSRQLPKLVQPMAPGPFLLPQLQSFPQTCPLSTTSQSNFHSHTGYFYHILRTTNPPASLPDTFI